MTSKDYFEYLWEWLSLNQLGEVAVMSPHVIQARRKENELGYISKLPEELLYQIFWQYRELCRKKGSMEWARVARVCHTWRDVAIKSTNLWNEVPIHNLKRVQELLSRSGQAPLVISSSKNSRGQDHKDHSIAFELVCEELYRVRELELTVPAILFPLLLEARKKSSARELTYIDLTIDGSVREISADNLLGSTGAPNLRSFKFASHGGVSWKSLATSLPNTLQELSITHTNRVPRRITELLVVLKSFPTLVSLHLDGVLPVASLDDPPPITLLSLTSISLCGTPVRSAAFLKHVRLPRVRSMQLRSVVTSPTGLGDLAPILADRINDAGSPSDFVSFSYNERTSVYDTDIRAWTTLGKSAHNLQSGARDFRMFITHQKHGETLPAFVSALPFRSVQSLYVFPGSRENSVVRHEDEQANWRTTFGNMKAVRTLNLHSRRKHILPFVLADDEYPRHELIELGMISLRQGQLAKERMKERIAMAMLAGFFPHLQNLVVRGVSQNLHGKAR